MLRSVTRSAVAGAAAALLLPLGILAVATPRAARPAGWGAATTTTAAAATRGVQRLSGVSALSATDAWAVGNACSGGCYTLRPLIMHWDGSAWSRVPAPAYPDATLAGVSADSATDAWAVGRYCGVSGCGTNARLRTFVLHWDGTSWTLAASPSPGADWNELDAVTAISPTDAWAVGHGTGFGHCAGCERPLLLHWDGRSWTRVASPVSRGAALSAVTAGSPGDVWAVGTVQTRSRGGLRSLVLRWNGAAWRRIASPDPGRRYTVPAAASLDGAGRLWVAGDACSSTHAGCFVSPGLHHRRLLIRWNGTGWTRYATPATRHGSYLTAVAAAGPDRAWAAGAACVSRCGRWPQPIAPVILAWHGTTWSFVALHGRRLRGAALEAAAADSPDDAWIVGSYCANGCSTPGRADRPLFLHWNGATWSQVR